MEGREHDAARRARRERQPPVDDHELAQLAEHECAQHRGQNEVGDRLGRHGVEDRRGVKLGVAARRAAQVQVGLVAHAGEVGAEAAGADAEDVCLQDGVLLEAKGLE